MIVSLHNTHREYCETRSKEEEVFYRTVSVNKLILPTKNVDVWIMLAENDSAPSVAHNVPTDLCSNLLTMSLLQAPPAILKGSIQTYTWKSVPLPVEGFTPSKQPPTTTSFIIETGLPAVSNINLQSQSRHDDGNRPHRKLRFYHSSRYTKRQTHEHRLARRDKHTAGSHKHCSTFVCQ